MKSRTKWFLGGLALVVGAVGTAGAFVKRRNMTAVTKREKNPGDVWARPGMMVTFRAELMPGRDREARTFRVKELLPSGRVSLQDANGEHTEKEFEPLDLG
jgi:hypothetical protein